MTTDSDASKNNGWKAHRLAQHREFQALTFDEKLEQIESLADFAREILEEHKRKGLPYIDPVSGKRVLGAAEDPGPYGKKN